MKPQNLNVNFATPNNIDSSSNSVFSSSVGASTDIPTVYSTISEPAYVENNQNDKFVEPDEVLAPLHSDE